MNDELVAHVVDGLVRLRAHALDGHVVVLDRHHNLVEQGTEQVTAGALVHLPVEVDGVRDEVDEGDGFRRTIAKPVVGAFQLLGDGTLAEGQVGELLLELRQRDRAVGREVDQAALLSLKLGELLRQLRLLGTLACEQVVQGRLDLVLQFRNVIRCERLPCDGTLDFRFDQVGANPVGVAECALLRGADVVLVVAAVAPDLGEDQATAASLLGAGAAVHDPLQEVEVDPITVALAVPLVEDCLYLEEGLLIVL